MSGGQLLSNVGDTGPGIAGENTAKGSNCLARMIVTTRVDDIGGSDADETESFPIDGSD